MTTWITDEHGNRTFTHDNWSVKVWNKEFGAFRINIHAPSGWGDKHEVEAGPDGIWVNGESRGGWEGPSPSSFTIPWPVIAAITEAWAIVEKEKE